MPMVQTMRVGIQLICVTLDQLLPTNVRSGAICYSQVNIIIQLWCRDLAEDSDNMGFKHVFPTHNEP